MDVDDWNRLCCERRMGSMCSDPDAPSNSHHNPSPSSFSPSVSSGSESYPLSRCSSLSSLSPAYSDSDTDTSDTDDSSDAVFLIGILKKPRFRGGHQQQRQRQQQQQRCERQINQSQRGFNCSRLKYHDGNNGNGQIHDKDEGSYELETGDHVQVEDDDDDEWQDCDDDDNESECEIIFERNVTFDDPLATDIITGVPVAPSSRSRVEWTALKARERLERRRGFLSGLEAGEEEEEGEESACHELKTIRAILREGGRGEESTAEDDADNDEVSLDALELETTLAIAQAVELELAR